MDEDMDSYNDYKTPGLTELKPDEYFNIDENKERSRRYTSSEVIKERNMCKGADDYICKGCDD